ncbi:MAG: site-specific integrase [Methyloversatilis sp.]|nr:site-specific integrase [Methyloversatilis sp.]
MVNTTDGIVLLETNNLNDAVRLAIEAVLSHLTVRYSSPPKRIKWASPHGFQYLFSDANIRKNANFDGEFLTTAFQFSGLDSQNRGASDYFNQLDKYLHGLRPDACAIASVKQGVKLLLVELWKRKVVLLPTVFSPGSHFDPIPIASELYSFIQSFDHNTASKGVVDEGARRLFYYMPRILFATTWGTPEDVSVKELAVLHRAQRLFMTGKSDIRFITSPVPWSLFLSELQKSFPSRVNFSPDDLIGYSQWAASGMVEHSYAEFLTQQRNIKSYSLPKRRRLFDYSSPKNHERNEVLLGLSNSKFHADALKYLKQYFGGNRRGLDWLDDESFHYSGREHISLNGLVPFWRQAMKDFLKHRKQVKGYEDDKSVTASLNHLADYLFLYLPWWKEIFPKSTLALPSAPKEFSRAAFVSRSSDLPLEEFPETLLSILKVRRSSKDSQYAALKHIQIFFRFVESAFSEDENIAGHNFRNPIYGEFDLPRVAKRTKTSKVVFPKGAYSYLVHYVYAVEAMGEFLSSKCMGSEFSEKKLLALKKMRWIDTAEFGFVPLIRFKGRVTHLTQVPNVFDWEVRTFKDSRNIKEEHFVPHLTTLRLLMVAIETGLRLAGLLWLDKRTWDKENSEGPLTTEFSFLPNGPYLYRLFVNTDKTKESPWVTEIVFRVRSVLLRESAFQLSIDEPGMNDSVPYKDREDSRFGEIVPLFRGSSSPKPITVSHYSEKWALLLTGFQSFFSNVQGHRALFVKVTPVSISPNSDEIKTVIMKDGTQFCPVSILAINTPHACRATYATNRQGLIETSDIAIQLGHSSTAVTEYYQSPRAEDLHEKLEAADRAIFDDVQRFESENQAYVRADKPDSVLARSFMADREAALKQFRVMPPIALWNTAETESLNGESIEELRSGPMSLVRFHPTHICPVGDECPADVIKLAGDFRRCGMCPLALKGIDHLPAIAAKKNWLLERIRYQLKQRDSFESSGDVEAAENLWDSVELDTNEWVGWQLSEEVLVKSHAEAMAEHGSSDEGLFYHAEQPEVVRNHLQRVVKYSSEVEFLLSRIAESNAYPTLQTPQIQAVASGIRRRLLASQDSQNFFSELPGPVDVTLAATMLKTLIGIKKLSLADLSDHLARPLVLPSSGLLRIGESK